MFFLVIVVEDNVMDDGIFFLIRLDMFLVWLMSWVSEMVLEVMEGL